MHRVVIFFHNAVACDFKTLVLYECGHDVALYLVLVLLRILAVEHLHLHLKELAGCVGVVCHLADKFCHFGVQLVGACGAQCPSHQGTLPYMGYGALAVYVGKCGVFIYIKLCGGGKCDGTDKKGSVGAVGGRGEEQIFIEFLVVSMPLGGETDFGE